MAGVTAKEFASSLPNVYEGCQLYNDVLEPLKDKEDAYVLEVLEAARVRGRTWREPAGLEWEDELETFLSKRRGVDVFKEWLKVPYVRATARELFDTSSDDGFFFDKRTIKLSTANKAWVSLGHALADLKLAELLQILLKEVPECGEFMVSDHRE
jgi:hypothetical protein